MERKSVKDSESKDNKSQKSVKKIIGGAVTALLSVIFAIVFIIFLVVMIQIGQGKKPSLAGHRFYVIVTDSMTPTINVDDVILSKIVNKNDTDLFVEGAVITYTAESGPMKGREVTHRIVKGVHFNEEINDFAVITKGDKAGAKEDYPVRLSTINAVMVRKTVLVSWLVGVFKHGAGFALLFALPLGIMLICLIVKLIMTIKNPALAEEKKKQTEEERIEEIKKKAVEEYLQSNSKDDEGKE